jgi:hypothetical protein
VAELGVLPLSKWKAVLMAVRKETIKKQANEMVFQALRPGEQIVSGVFAISGPSPWLMSQLGLVGQIFIDHYYVAVTQQQVIFVKMGRLANRPKEIAFAAPLQNAGVSNYKRSAVWSSFRYNIGTAKPLRLNVHRTWRQELDALVGAFGVPVA